MNDDDHLDFAVTFKKMDCVAIWLGSEDGTFRRGQIVRVGDNLPSDLGDDDGTTCVVLADFDHDGHLDLATANDTSNSVSVRFGNGDGTFAQFGEEYTVGDDSEFILTADFNDDGCMDLATGNEDSRDVSILINKGPNRGGDPFSFYDPDSVSVSYIPDELAAGDFNGDGLIDVATANGRSHDVSILLGRGDGTFRPELRFDVGEMPHAIVTGDFNQDGRPDLATANERSDNVSILLGLGDGRFWFAQHLPVGDSPWSLVAGDFDHDGFEDLATANRTMNGVSVLYGKGNGKFIEPQWQLSVGEFPERIIAADFNGDGSLDLGTVNRLSHDVSVLLNQPGKRGFLPAETRTDFPPHVPSASSLVPGWSEGSVAEKLPESEDDIRFFPRGVVTGFFNNGPYLDLAVADDRANEVSVFLGYGDGAYQPPLRLPTANDPEWIATGDFDGDGKLDLVTGARPRGGRVDYVGAR